MTRRPTPYSLAESVDQRIVPLVEVGCWVWTGSHTPKGYAQFTYKGRTFRVHRYQFERYVGPIPDGFTIDHVWARGCRFKDCVNPAHLEPVSGPVNTLRGGGRAAVNARKTHCPQGHLYDEENTKRYKGRRYCRTCRGWQ